MSFGKLLYLSELLLNHLKNGAKLLSVMRVKCNHGGKAPRPEGTPYPYGLPNLVNSSSWLWNPQRVGFSLSFQILPLPKGNPVCSQALVTHRILPSFYHTCSSCLEADLQYHPLQGGCPDSPIPKPGVVSYSLLCTLNTGACFKTTSFM